MAQVKFNRGTWRSEGLGSNDISFLQATAQSPTGSAADSGDYGFIYVGNILSATKYIKALDTKGYTTPSQSITPSGGTATTHYKDALMYIGHNTSTNVLDSNITGLLGIDTASIVGLDGYTAENTSIMTAAGVAAYVTSVASLADKYHGTGSWGNPSAQSGNTDPFKYIAKFYQNIHGTVTEITTGTTGYQALEFTLPVTTSVGTYDPTDDTTITTPAAVAKYFANLAGAMDYKGSLTAAVAGGTHSAAYKSGDVFVASEAISSIGAEAGDMVIVNAAIPANTAFSSSNCDVFERNLDGAVTAGSNLVANQMVVGSGNKQVQSLSLSGGSMIYGAASGGTVTQLSIGTSGKFLTSTGNAPQWSDYYEVSIAAAGSGSTGIDLTLYKNGSIISAAELYHGMQFNASGKLNIPISASSATTASYADKVQMSENGSESKILVQGSAGTGSYTSYYGVNYETSATITGDGTIKGKDVRIIETGTTYVNVSDSILWHDLT